MSVEEDSEFFRKTALKGNPLANIYHDIGWIVSNQVEVGLLDCYTQTLKHYIKSSSDIEESLNSSAGKYFNHAMLMHPGDAREIAKMLKINPRGLSRLLVRRYLD